MQASKLQPSAMFNVLTQRGIIEVVTPPDARAGTVEIFTAGQVIMSPNTDFKLSGLYAKAMQGDKLIATFKAHVEFPFEPIPEGKLGEPALLEEAERTNRELFMQRFFPRIDGFTHALSIFMSFCASEGNTLKITETTNPPCLVTGVLANVVLDGDLVPDAVPFPPYALDLENNWEFIMETIRNSGHMSTPAAVWHSYNALGFHGFQNELAGMLEQTMIYIKALRQRDPRLETFRLSGSAKH